MDLTLLCAGGLTAFDATLIGTSVVLVFALLVVLSLVITLEGRLFDALNRKKEGGAPEKTAGSAAPGTPPAAPPAPTVSDVSAAAPPADGQSAVADEVVAAIAAAVYCMEGPGAVVRSVRRLPQSGGKQRGAWGDAGVEQNTRPFVF